FIFLPLLSTPTSTLFPYTTLFRSYDSARSKVVLFGGHTGTNVPDTWELDSATGQWAPIVLATQPAYRESAGLAFFPQRGKVVLRSEEHTSELQSRGHLVCRLLLEK